MGDREGFVVFIYFDITLVGKTQLPLMDDLIHE
jgi:hypothetical protein